MGKFDPVYCAEDDLRWIYPNIAKFGQKRTVSGWVADSLLTDRYKCGSTGTISVLYKDGIELAAAQSALANVTSDDKWYYDSAADTLYYFNDGDNPNELDIEAGTDWATLVTNAIARASDSVRAIVGKPIYKHRFRDNNYDSDIVYGTAAIACRYLIRPHNQELADALAVIYDNEEGDNGLPKGKLQKIRDGQISMTSEITPSLGKGILVENSLDTTTTGGIDKIRGKAVENDILNVSIVTGGTFSYGSTSTVTYQVKGKSSTGLMNSTIVAATTIDGDYQTLTDGLELRFVPGIYVANDSWYIEVSREEVETHESIHSNIATTVW